LNIIPKQIRKKYQLEKVNKGVKCSKFENVYSVRSGLQLFQKIIIQFMHLLTSQILNTKLTNYYMFSRTLVPEIGEVHSTENQFLRSQKLKVVN
jgi:hypothetical protein